METTSIEMKSMETKPMKNKTKFWIGTSIISVVAIVLIAVLLSGITMVGVGQVGIVKHADGQVTQIGQGIHFTGWFVGVQEYPTYTQALILSNLGYEGGYSNQQWIVGTADQQELPVNTSLTWRINPQDAADVYQAVGGQPLSYVTNNIVEPTMKMVVNEVTHEYDYSSLRGQQLPQATEEINKDLTAALAKDGIIVEKFGFTYLGLPQGMQAAQGQLASAEIAKQQAAAQQQQQIILNKTKILTAEADAKANEIEAVGLKAKASALNALIVQEEAIQKWDGKLPSTMSSSVIPFLNSAVK